MPTPSQVHTVVCRVLLFGARWQHALFALAPFVLFVSGCSPATSSAPTPTAVRTAEPAPRTRPPVPAPSANETPFSSGTPDSDIDNELAIPASPPAQPAVKRLPTFRVDTIPPEQLAAHGIRRLDSARLTLLTDLDRELAETLPPLVDQLFIALTQAIGPIPEDPAQPFRMVGHLIVDESVFAAAGLLPEGLPPIEHGRHLGLEFWFRNQATDYYTRHLLLHEATHCISLWLGRQQHPQWFIEGLAELFATHRLDESGNATFRALPAKKGEFPGWGRTKVIRNEVAAGRWLSLPDFESAFDRLVQGPEAYAWSWAIGYFLDQHPRYRERFRAATRELDTQNFLALLDQSYAPDRAELEIEWQLFARQMEEGYWLEHTAINWEGANPQPRTQSPEQPREGKHQVSVAANQGWQPTGLSVAAGDQFEISATGQILLKQSPPGWVSEPGGVTIRYAYGRPLGELHALVLPDPLSATITHEGLRELARKTQQQQPEPIGLGKTWTASSSGLLFLRVNDYFSELADNSGQYTVEFARRQDP